MPPTAHQANYRSCQPCRREAYFAEFVFSRMNRDLLNLENPLGLRRFVRPNFSGEPGKRRIDVPFSHTLYFQNKFAPCKLHAQANMEFWD